MSSPEYPALLLDASTPTIQTGVMEAGRWLAFEQTEGDALTQLPELVRCVLEKSGTEMKDIRSILHCEGPGSLLGLRMAAMLVRTWKALPFMRPCRLLAYRSLPMAAALSPEAASQIATPFRRGSFSVWKREDGSYSIMSGEELDARGEKFSILGQRNMKAMPACGQLLPYSLETLPEHLATDDSVLAEAQEAVVYAPALSEYKLWTGERHRAG